MKLYQIPYLPETSSQEALERMVLTTDAAIVTRNQPAFLPDLSEHWALELLPAWHICRLGKTVAEKFAYRYYDGMTIIARLKPLDLLARLGTTDTTPHPIASTFDGCVALNKWLDPTDGPVEVDVTSPVTEKITAERPINRAIEDISRYITLKTGDIIAVGPPILTFPVEINTHVEVRLYDHKILSYNIK